MSMALDFSDDSFNDEYESLKPSKDWTVEHLAEYTKDRLKFASFFGRKSAIQLYRAGVAVNYAKKILVQDRKWTVWAKQHGIPLGAAYEVSKIADTFDTEEDIKGYTAVEAKLIAGIRKPKKSKGEKPEGRSKVDNLPATVAKGGDKDATDASPAIVATSGGNKPTVARGTPGEPLPIGNQVPPVKMPNDLEADLVKVCNLVRHTIKAVNDSGNKVKPSTTMTVKDTLADLRSFVECAA